MGEQRLVRPQPGYSLPPGELPDWVIADTHFWHDNIAAYCGRPAHHTALMLGRWWEAVRPGDLVLHLGDVAYHRQADLEPVLSRLPGRVYLVPGNHDGPKLRAVYRRMGWRLVQPFDLMYRGWKVRFSHWPLPPELPPGWLNVHGHLHNNRPPVSERHLNVSVELMGYQPQRLGLALDAHLIRLAAVDHPQESTSTWSVGRQAL